MDEIDNKPMRSRLWMALAVLLVTTFGLLVRTPWSGRVATATFNLLHGPVFCFVAWILMWLVPTTMQNRHRRMRLGIALLLVGFGAVTEYAQQFVGRNTNWHDLIANCLGVLAGYLMFAWMLRRQQRQALVPLVTAIIVLLAAVQPGVTQLIDCVRVRREFPLLDSFENGHARWLGSHASVETIRDPQLATHGQYVLGWHLKPGQYPGCRMFEPPRDWSEFDRLKFDIRLDAEAPVDQLTVIVKLYDTPHRSNGFQHKDRFQLELLLKKGEWQPVSIELADIKNAPETRTMEMTRIELLQFFAIDPTQAVTVYIDHVRLTHSDQ